MGWKINASSLPQRVPVNRGFEPDLEGGDLNSCLYDLRTISVECKKDIFDVEEEELNFAKETVVAKTRNT